MSDWPWNMERITGSLRGVLGRGHGARIGETAVASLKVHTIDAARPAEVRVLTGSDAGRVFYGRREAGEVVHLDIFHQQGSVDHRRVAAAVRRAAVEFWGPGGAYGPALDQIDVQTATGGGRVTGSLKFGRKESLRNAHRNHVHVAARLAASDLGLLLFLVAEIEDEITAQGHEIRRIDTVSNDAPAGGAPMDLSPYADETDSLLRQSDSDRGREGGWGPAESEVPLSDMMEILDEIDPGELKEVLDGMEEGTSRSAAVARMPRGQWEAGDILRRLEEKGWVRSEQARLFLTPEGRKVRSYLSSHLREVEMRLRKMIRRTPWKSAPRNSRAPIEPAVRTRGSGIIRGVTPAETRGWLCDLAIPETVIQSFKRAFLGSDGGSKSRGGRPVGGSSENPGPSICREDLQVYQRYKTRPTDVCLLLDASASMAGRRLKAAKYLARHLLLSTRDKVAVIAFQEGEVRVYVPFTRNYYKVEEGLRKIKPFGLTPLAHGLMESYDFIRASRSKNPLLLLITDGIPTVPKWTVNPIEDALTAATYIARGKINFGCIGLQPSRPYLERLVTEAKGALYVVDELDKEALVRVAYQERRRKGS